MTAAGYRDPAAVGGRRVLAALIDLIIYFALGWVLFIAMATRIGGEAGDAGCTEYQDRVGGVNLCAGFNGDINVIGGGTAFVYLALTVAIWLAYHGLLQGLVGATPGKLVTGLRVVDAAGAPAGIPRNLLRSATLAVGWLAFGVGFFIAALVGAILILGGRDHQRVGDRLAKTYVVRTRDLGRPPSQAAQLGDGAVMSTGTPPPPPPSPQTDR